ncbi:MAG: hypothetical protein MJ211_15820 [Bacteroidales bacterium]|nr:hypothetical protein [Bacteroidales bacterium]
MKKKLILALLMACFAIVACDKEKDQYQTPQINKRILKLNKDCINYISPQDKCDTVDIFSSIKINLNYSCNEVNEYNYSSKVNIDTFEILNTKNNNKVDGAFSISEDGLSIIFSPEEPLEPNTEYNIKANVSMLKLVEDEWVVAQNMNDSLIIEEKVSSFTTGDAVNCIKPQHILCSYPIDRMYNLYSKETNTGYICLSENYRFLLNKIPEGYTQQLRLSTEDGIYQDIDFTHFKSTEIENQKYEINFDLSKLNFDNQKIYKLQILQIPTNGNSSETKQIWSIDFRTSKYNTLKEKVDDIGLEGIAKFTGNNLFIKDIEFSFTTDDFFDVYEQQEKGKYDNLVCLNADLENTEWFKSSIYYEMYHKYSETEIKRDRDFSYPPTDAMTVFNPLSINHDYLTDDEINTGETLGIYNYGCITHNVIRECHEDLKVLRDKIGSKRQHGETLTEYEQKVLKYQNPESLTKGNYPYTISYRLPGKNIITSEIHKVLTCN